MSTVKSHSLKSFLKTYFLFIGIIIAVINAFMIVFIYHRGIDETSEIYLTEDAYEAQFLLKEEGNLPPNTDLVQYYKSIEKLPNKYILPIGINHLEIQHFDFENTYDYLMYFREKEQKKPFYVVHSFSKSDETVILNLTISQIIFMISIVVICFLLLSSLSIYRIINNSIGNLYNWVIQNKPENTSNESQKFNTQGRGFTEINTIAERLNFYINSHQKRQEREQKSIRSLSHELRTPMAIIQVALDILDTKEIPQYISDKILKIKNANDDMIETSTLILNMWQSANEKSSTVCLNVNNEIKNILSNLKFTNDRQDLEFNIDVSDSFVIKTSKHSFQMLLTNIIGNMFKHSGSGKTYIYTQGKNIIFKNRLNHDKTCDTKWHNTNHGIGHIVIQTICDHLEWNFKTNQDQGFYFVNIELL